MQDQTPRGSKWRKVIKFAAIFATILLLIAGIAYMRTDIGEAAASYEKNKYAAKLAGLCFTAQDAANLYEVPDEENGALLLGDVVKDITTNHLDYSGPQIDRSSEEEILIAWKIIAPQLPVLKIALAKPRLIFPRKFDQPYFEPRDIGALVGFTRLMVSRASIAIKKNDRALAIDLLLTAANLSVHIGDEPCLTALQFRSTSAMMIEKLLRALIPKYANDQQWCKAFERILAILDQPYNVKGVLQFEHWGWIWSGQILLGDTSVGTLQDLGLKQEDSTPTITLASRFIPRFQAANLSRVHQLYVEAVSGLPSDLNDFVAVSKSISDANSHIDYSDTGLSYAYARHQFMSHSPTVGSMEIVEIVETETARRNVLFQALALLKAGASPGKGFLLPGRFAMDVGGGKLGLYHSKDGWTIFSVGRNGTKEHTIAPPAVGDDFVVRLPK